MRYDTANQFFHFFYKSKGKDIRCQSELPGLKILLSWLGVAASLLLLAGCTSSPISPATITPEPTRTLAPVQVKTTSVPDPKEAAEAFLDAWRVEDYTTMYGMLTSLSQDAISLEDLRSEVDSLDCDLDTC